jgi:YVTN family beta-propeller protein
MNRILFRPGRAVAAAATLLALVVAPAALIAGDHSGPVVLMLNKSDDTVAFVDPDTLEVLGKTPTGVGPHEVAVGPAGRYAYVANYGRQGSPGGDLTVIDVPARKAVGRIDLGKKCMPHGLAFGPGGKELWLTCEEDQLVLVVDPKQQKVIRSYDTGQEVTHMIVVTPDGHQAFTANIGSDTVTVIDAKSGAVSQIKVGKGPEGIDITPDGKEVWVAHRNGGDLSIISSRTHEILETFAVGEFPIRVKFTPNGKYALVSNAQGHDLAVVDVKSREVVRRVQLDEVPIGVLITPDGKTGFVANTQADVVSVLDLSTWEITGQVRPGDEPDGLGWASGGGS